VFRACVVGKVIGADEDMPGALQMPNQITLADARLDEVSPRPEVRQERLDRGRGRCIGVLRPTLERGPFSHLIASGGPTVSA